MNKEIFIVDLYGYLNENTESSKICKKYQEHNKKLIESNPDRGFSYKIIDITPEQENYLKENTELYNLSNKHKYQMISDYVRYEYLKNNPGSIFIDTDFVIFGLFGLIELGRLRNFAIETGKDFTAGEIGRHGQHSCNWLMISSGGENSLSSQLSNLLVEKSSKDSIVNWKLSNHKFRRNRLEILYSAPSNKLGVCPPRQDWEDIETDEDYERRVVFGLFWGYKLYEGINPSDYFQIPYYNWQCSFWDGDWKDKNVIHPDELLGCHFFGFAKGRPSITEFLEYHNLTNKYSEL